MMLPLRLVILHLTMTRVVALWFGGGSTISPPGLSSARHRPPEKRLLDYLLANYTSTARPVRNATDVVNVTLRYRVAKINDLDEKSQVLITTGILVQSWKDLQLAWDKEQFDNLSSLRIPVNQLWVPDITLLNSASDNILRLYSDLALVSHTGLVKWPAHVRLRSHCPMLMSFFPYDSHLCDTIFMSITYPSKYVEIYVVNAAQKPIIENRKWKFLSVLNYQDSHFFTGEERHSTVTYTFGLRRSSLYERLLFALMPLLLSVLLLVVWMVPLQSAQRLLLGVGILVTTTLLLLIMESHLPAEMKTMPLAGQYLFFVLLMSTLSLLLSLVSLRSYHTKLGQGQVPTWMRKVFIRCLGKNVFRLKSIPYAEEGQTIFSHHATVESSTAEMEPMPSVVDDIDLGLGSGGSMLSLLEDIQRYLCVCIRREIAPPSLNHQELVIVEWRLVALVFDRFMFWLTFIVTIIVGIVCIHMQY